MARRSWDDIEREVEAGPRWGWFWRGLGLLLVLGIGFTLLGFAQGWFSRGAEIVGPRNVSDQHFQIAEGWQSLQVAAANVCTAGTTQANENSPTLVEDPTLAYKATFRNIAAEYNRRQANLFEAKIAGPPGYPERVVIPGDGADWCTISGEMALIP